MLNNGNILGINNIITYKPYASNHIPIILINDDITTFPINQKALHLVIGGEGFNCIMDHTESSYVPKCDNCKVGYYLVEDQSSTCFDQLSKPRTYFLDKSVSLWVFRKCSESCYECEGTLNNCLTCNPGYYFQSGTTNWIPCEGDGLYILGNSCYNCNALWWFLHSRWTK